MILTTERLTLRPWTVDDAEDAFVIYGDPEVTRYIGGQTLDSVAAMRERLGQQIARTSQYPEGFDAWAAVLDGTVIGCGLCKFLPGSPDRNVLTEHIEIGWHLGRRWWGQGFATEMGACLLDHALNAQQADDVHAVMEPPNRASMKVAERLGMTHVGRTTAYYGGLDLEHYRLRPET